MRVFFLLSNTIWVHTLPEGFIDAGHEVKISGSIFKSSIPKVISDFKPDLMISIGRGSNQTEKGQLLARKYSKAAKVPHIYWSTEDPGFTWEFSLPFIQRTEPDFVFSTCTSTVEYFKKLSIKAAHLDFGYAPKIHKRVEYKGSYNSQIAIVANVHPDKLQKYPDYCRLQSMETLITPLLQEGIPIDFWGRDWDRASSFLKYDIPENWIHGYLPYKDAHHIYGSSKIMIALQNYPNQLTQQTYEILASGGFILTSDTPCIRSRFKIGKELLVSSSPKETVNLVKEYFHHPERCNAIAENGRTRVIDDHYTNRANYMIEVLKKEKIL